MKKILVCAMIMMMVSAMIANAETVLSYIDWDSYDCGCTDIAENEDGTYSCTVWVGEHWEALITSDSLEDAEEAHVDVFYDDVLFDSYDSRIDDDSDDTKVENMYLTMIMFYDGLWGA